MAPALRGGIPHCNLIQPSLNEVQAILTSTSIVAGWLTGVSHTAGQLPGA